jgi:hypothetical protein
MASASPTSRVVSPSSLPIVARVPLGHLFGALATDLQRLIWPRYMVLHELMIFGRLCRNGILWLKHYLQMELDHWFVNACNHAIPASIWSLPKRLQVTS